MSHGFEIADEPVRFSRAVAKTSVSKSFSDLLKPAWKGQITIEARAYY